MFLKNLLLLFFIIFLSDIAANEEFSKSVKEKKIYPMGKKIYEKMCNQDINLEKYSTIDVLKDSIINENLCKPIKEDYLEALCLYLWEVKRVAGHVDAQNTIIVNKDEKCPICGMFVYKYPKWAAQIFYEKSHLSFDGVKDMMKYYFQEESNIEKILVTDYYSQKAIEAQKAYFVLGSDVYGPMGDELIPFENESDAKNFYMDHKGSKILNFSEITAEDISKLDE
jgi:nitrous oxide reductase accessory protein NosL